MPIIKSARKKLRQDKIKTKTNLKYIIAYKKAINALKKQKSAAALKATHKAIDKALKRKVFHKNKANRLKSQASKLVRSFSTKKQVKSK